MKYTLRFLIIAYAMLSSATAYSASQVNWFNKTNQKTTTTVSSRWSPVSSDINVTSSRNNRYIDFTTRRYYSSGGGGINTTVTNKSFRTDRTVSNSVRSNSVATKTHYTINKSYIYDANINAQLADVGTQEYATNGMNDGEGGRPRVDRIRRGTDPSEGGTEGNGTTPGTQDTTTPLTDAVPCLVVMILAFAVIKYKKMH